MTNIKSVRVINELLLPTFLRNCGQRSADNVIKLKKTQTLKTTILVHSTMSLFVLRVAL
jgi:hypothetical protein